jgi:cellulose synthase/poly-beta-1,6-N-acetylglucosamine synthase-like glycosyltransferase
MHWVLAISIALLAYIYAGYPALIWVLSRVWSRPVKKGPFAGGVSVLIAAHNEAGALPTKVAGLLELSKTEPIREICIGLDGCTDGTGERVREIIRISNIQYSISNGQGGQDRGAVQPSTCTLQPAPRIHILEFERQRGKAAVLNDLMAKATQPVFVMMDARQRVEPGAIGHLLENFADDQVGVVSGALVYESADAGVQKGAASYWGYEKFLRLCESRFWAVPGATGALYAIRRELCRPIPENTLVDDVLIPVRACLAGYRCLFDPSARVFDLPSVNFDKEGARKRRTLAGIWQLSHVEPKILSISANPICFQWVSHKYLRLFTPFIIIIALVSAGMMEWWNSGWGTVVFGGIVLGFAVSFLAFWAGTRVQSRVLGLLGAFFGVNLALIQAAWDAWTGRFEARWKR